MKGNLESVTIRFNVQYKDKSNDGETMNIYYNVESYTPQIWNHICINMYDVVSANTELSNDRKPGSSVYMKIIYISRPLYVDDIWIGRIPLTGRRRFLPRYCNIAGSATLRKHG
jgi:hypothetical protein